MDSDNSGSLQSSSGGDIEDYDSRAAATSFLMTRPISNSTAPPLFGRFSDYAQPHNPSTPWTGPVSMRSGPNPIIRQAAAAARSQNKAARKPRKRARASRRAPTTVLATDTANFRAMVQEFTGIPAPPSFTRCGLDLFETAAQPPPFLVSSAVSTPVNYQLPFTQNSNLFNVQNPNALTSLLQSNPKFLFPNSDMMISKPHDEDSYPFVLNHHQMKIPNYVENAETGYHYNQMKTTTTGGGDYCFSDEKMNCAGGRGSENAATRAEGMVESWSFIQTFEGDS